VDRLEAHERQGGDQLAEVGVAENVLNVAELERISPGVLFFRPG
jgi:hypothetical protein